MNAARRERQEGVGIRVAMADMRQQLYQCISYQSFPPKLDPVCDVRKPMWWQITDGQVCGSNGCLYLPEGSSRLQLAPLSSSRTQQAWSIDAEGHFVLQGDPLKRCLKIGPDRFLSMTPCTPAHPRVAIVSHQMFFRPVKEQDVDEATIFDFSTVNTANNLIYLHASRKASFPIVEPNGQLLARGEALNLWKHVQLLKGTPGNRMSFLLAFESVARRQTLTHDK
eukprot:m.426051 g.426051  ORF g.426051 m.426051 type:complete len:224 (+) comp56684_c0_seq5:89-760(+)